MLRCLFIMYCFYLHFLFTDRQVGKVGNRNCSESFSEFDKLKAHLKASHEGSEWPWICGFCDLVLLYDLEFEVHIKQHTEKAPFACPICSRLFSDNSRLREHLARQHLPSRDPGKAGDGGPSSSSASNKAGSNQPPRPQPSAAQIKFEKQQAQLAQHQLQAFERLRSSIAASSSSLTQPQQPSTMSDSHGGSRRSTRGGGGDTAVATSTSTASNVKDEAAVSRELAALLLNLHDSNGRAPVTKVDNFSSQNSAAVQAAAAAAAAAAASSIQLPKAEDLSLKSSVETAIDLTKSKPEITLTPTMPASITKLVKGQTSNSSSGI